MQKICEISRKLFTGILYTRYNRFRTREKIPCKGGVIMNIFEMAQIPLNKAIEAMQLDAGAAQIIADRKSVV